jgi:hypothetical protein
LSETVPMATLKEVFDLRGTRDVLAVLRDPATIRLRAAAVVRAVEAKRSPWFTLDRSRLPEAAARVVALMRRRFPAGQPAGGWPLHSRWRHFEAGGVDRRAELDGLLSAQPPWEQLRAQIDLTVVSVLLDAGAGAAWRFEERVGDWSSRDKALALPAAHLPKDDLMALLDQAASGALRSGAESVGDTAAPSMPSMPSTPSTGSTGSTGSAPEPASEAPAAQPPAPAPAGAQTVGSYTRSEGLAVASFRAFVAGAFSADREQPLQADGATLALLDAAALRALFQASPSNPLVGLEGRAALMARLGRVLQEHAGRDGGLARPCRIIDLVTQGGQQRHVTATALFQQVLRSLAPIWTSGSTIGGVPAGDVWPHRWAGAEVPGAVPDARPFNGLSAGWVPFHKLSQWLTYSLVEPLRWAGIHVTGLQALTGLPEYRNGGLLLDAGVIVPRDPRDLNTPRRPGDEMVVEWRALTVVLLDELAVLVRQAFSASEEELPLCAVLEGGTWAAGREIAAERRSGGTPPLAIDSDGTVF